MVIYEKNRSWRAVFFTSFFYNIIHLSSRLHLQITSDVWNTMQWTYTYICIQYYGLSTSFKEDFCLTYFLLFFFFLFLFLLLLCWNKEHNFNKNCGYTVQLKFNKQEFVLLFKKNTQERKHTIIPVTINSNLAYVPPISLPITENLITQKKKPTSSV